MHNWFVARSIIFFNLRFVKIRIFFVKFKHSYKSSVTHFNPSDLYENAYMRMCAGRFNHELWLHNNCLRGLRSFVRL